MISFIRGKLVQKERDYIIVDVHGIGYRISVPPTSNLSESDEIEVYTHLHVKENAFELYGFFSLEEEELFERLIGVSGVGPKTAMNILSKASVSELKTAIDREDIDIMMNVSGIGKKTAQRLILELKGKLGEEIEATEMRDAVSALTSLGYRPTDARGATRKAAAELEDYTVEDLIRTSLRFL
jgi:Holliday junction DNA helicase RuvA